jgi:hypothetical protein
MKGIHVDENGLAAEASARYRRSFGNQAGNDFLIATQNWKYLTHLQKIANLKDD